MSETTLPIVAAAEQEVCRDVLVEKYAKDKETTIAEVRARVARALAQPEPEERRQQWERRFRQALEDGFIPAGRINSAAGIQLQATLINCFVQPVGDSISELVDGRPGIYTALQEAAEELQQALRSRAEETLVRADQARQRAADTLARLDATQRRG